MVCRLEHRLAVCAETVDRDLHFRQTSIPDVLHFTEHALANRGIFDLDTDDLDLRAIRNGFRCRGRTRRR